jgi:hypothetical protein
MKKKKTSTKKRNRKPALAGTTGSVPLLPKTRKSPFVLPYIENRPDEQIVSMVQHAGTIFIATRYRIYRLGDNKEWQPIPFVDSPNA